MKATLPIGVRHAPTRSTYLVPPVALCAAIKPICLIYLKYDSVCVFIIQFKTIKSFKFIKQMAEIMKSTT